jgi:hypothetical protein
MDLILKKYGKKHFKFGRGMFQRKKKKEML